ncbi:glycosyl hydrolase [Kineococcus gynurae]|uniref:Glycosyl hydrolase n=1 Tax=Kineococcus gynurae TaxID=452979 RepID=A0ABV5LTS8_9ACTN
MVDTTQSAQAQPAPEPPRRPRGPGRRWLIGAGAAVVAGGAGVAWWASDRDGRPTASPSTGPGATGSTGEWAPREPADAVDLDSKWIGTYRSHDVVDLEQFGDFVSQPVAVGVVFTSQTDWHDLTHPWFANDAPEGQDWGAWVREAPDSRKLSIAVHLAPEDPDDDWRERGAAGEYDSYWVDLGENLVSLGLGSSILRLGWEMNGTWYENHYVGESEEQREAWKAYFRRIVRAVEVPGSDFEIDFCIAEGPQNSVDISELYPGDEYVDIIGVDVYDSYIAPIDPDARWQAKGEKMNSVAEVVRFAAERNKPLSFPEWAMVAEGDTQGGGDSPEFIDQMADVIAGNPVRYQAYFDVPDGGVGMTLSDAPRGAAAFRERFGPGGDAAPTDA